MNAPFPPSGHPVRVIDSGPLIALADKGDRYHVIMADWFRRVPRQQRLVVPIPVITEVCYFLGVSRGRPDLEADFLNDLGGDRRWSLYSPGRAEVVRMGQVVAAFPYLNLGAADAAVVVTAERFDTRRLVSIDTRDFSQIPLVRGAGYGVWPGNDPTGSAATDDPW